MLKFLKNLFSKNNQAEEQQEPDLEPEDILNDLQPKIDLLAEDCIGIKIKTGKALRLANSKFGGKPFFPQNGQYPLDKNGNPMRLLAQINFAELPPFPMLPNQGLLQFHLSQDDDLWGIDFNDKRNQNNWRTVFFENTDFEPIKNPEVLFSKSWQYSPLNSGPFGLEFEIRKDYPSSPSLEYENQILPLFKNVEKGDYEDFLEDLYLDKKLALGHKIGGFPHFTQNDFREGSRRYNDYRLLLQIDSEYDQIMWGDMGVAGFFIRPEDLAKRDFSKVAFSWDCH